MVSGLIPHGTFEFPPPFEIFTQMEDDLRTKGHFKVGGEFECTMRDYHGNHTNTWPEWMILDTLVQFFIAVQIKIFSEIKNGPRW